MQDLAEAVVWMSWAFVLGLTHWIGYLERKKLYRTIEAQRRVNVQAQDALQRHELWRINVSNFLVMLSESGPDQIRAIAKSLLPDNVEVQRIEVKATETKPGPVH
jgi:hypothetical protein